MRLIRLLLLPFALVYGLIVILRNLAFDLGIFRSRKFNIPIISVGNLVVGGSGKSPMTEYLVRLLSGTNKIATLSRGYGRKSKGFRLAEIDSLADEVGDEPLQFKHKFPGITVAVSEKRVKGVEQLEADHDLIILDDAYQHRWVKPGLSLLLFDFNSLFDFQLPLPAGDLREPLIGRKRADIIVVTKTPINLSPDQKARTIHRIKPYPHQEVFFSYLDYGNLQPIGKEFTERELSSLAESSPIILLTGIANPFGLLNEIEKYSGNVEHYNYPDHHQFSKKNITKLVAAFKALPAVDKLVVTTEKDLQRLNPALRELLKGLPVYYLPVTAAIHQPDSDRFNNLIKKYVTEHSVNHRIHKA